MLPIFRTALASAALAVAMAEDGFPEPFDTQKTDVQPLTPAAESLRRLAVPPGFHTTLFASEPEVRQPIAMAFDARGRLWVAENYTYGDASNQFDRSLRDRIIILEDTQGTGHADRRTVFWDRGQLLTSIAVGCGGVFALCPPRLLFIPAADGGDRPTGEPQVLLDGFNDGDVRHNIANGLKWGPDGWLYGRHGILAASHVGRPGAAKEERVTMDCGIWRFHPQRKVFEVVARGTTNPWGMDWDENGEGFFINTVIGHLWHLIPGAHYRRMYGEDPDPHVYGAIEQHADHLHWGGGEKWTDVRSGTVSDATSAAGGGHAHSGLMIYQGNNWPEAYRGALFTLNFHGRRVNMDTLAPQGSGYVGHHGGDPVTSTDPWFRGVDLGSGPDGGVFILDWSDIGECHERDGIHRSSGRIFELTHGERLAQAAPALDATSDVALVAQLRSADDWYARQARQLLQWRAAAGRDQGAIHAPLRELVASGPRVHRLRALWTLHAIGAAEETFLIPLLGDADEHLRIWAVRLLTDALPLRDLATAPAVETIDGSLTDALQRCAASEGSPAVRLALAASLQRLPLATRPVIAASLLAHGEDAADHNLPLMLWFGIKDLATTDPHALTALALTGRIPLVQRYAARRLAEDVRSAHGGLDALLRMATGMSAAARNEVLAGLAEAWTGWRKAPKPEGWDAFQGSFASPGMVVGDPVQAGQLRDLGALFGDGRALAACYLAVFATDLELAQRRTALRTLIESRPEDLRSVCERLLADQDLNAEAARGLAGYDDPVIAEALVSRYRSLFRAEARPGVLGILVSRPSFARVLLAHIGPGPGQVPRADLTPFHSRQIRALGDAQVTARLEEVWGVQRDLPADKLAALAAWTARLTSAALAAADRSQGRLVFLQTCSPCHTLFGTGGAIGPNLTGANRDNLNYLLENIIDPSAVVAADFRLAVVTLKDGRVLSGILAARAAQTITVQTMGERVTIERADVGHIQELSQSLMPDGLLQSLSETQVRDLLGYLMSKEQVPLPERPAGPSQRP